MSNTRPDVALSRVQTVYAVIQNTPGVVAVPGPAQLILPTGDAVANQSTPVTDSREKADTLDVRNVFQGVASPATVELSMYLRTAGCARPPQGEALLEALQGKRVPAATGVLTAELAVDGQTLTLSATDAALPERGVVRLTSSGISECIHYRSMTRTDRSVTLSDLTRGYAHTTPAVFPEGADALLESRWYAQTTHRPELTLWIQTDSTLQCVEGCRVTEASLALAISDAVEFRFSLTGRRLWNAGESPLAVEAASGSTEIQVVNARAFFEGQLLRNTACPEETHRVLAVDELTGLLRLDTPLADLWAKDDIVTWALPVGDPIGREVENRDTTMRVAGERGVMLPGSIKLGTPVRFTEEVGDRFPGQGIDDTRSCSIDYNVLMRKDAALRLREGFEGHEVRYDAEFGAEEGCRMALVAPRMKLTTASVGFQSPTVTLSTSGRLLGMGKGENSVQIILE